MFEVGKLSDESLDSLLTELDRICTDDSEGEAQRYFEHALTLRSTVQFLRKARTSEGFDAGSWGGGLDLIRVESLQSLNAEIYSRLMRKNYHLLVAMAPLSMEIRSGSVDGLPPFWGPPLPEFTSPWFKLFLYQTTEAGPPTLLLSKGTRLRRLPSVFHRFDRVLITPWGHDSGLAPASNALFVLNEALTHSALMIQGYGTPPQQHLDTFHVSFPFHDGQEEFWMNHPVVQRVRKELDLQNSCGFVTMVNLSLEKNPAVETAGRSRSSTCASSSPTNGIKGLLTVVDIPLNQVLWQRFSHTLDVNCAEILQEELDTLDEAERVSKPHALPATALEQLDESEWTVLNVDFGIPLFDSQLNAQVCERITSQQLWQRERLDALASTQNSLSERLVDFIRQHIDASDSKGSADVVALPTKNLLFVDGKLSQWSGD